MSIRYVISKTNYKPRFVYFSGFISAILVYLMLDTGVATAGQDQYRLVALGDSLTAGYGLANADSFPSQLETALKNKGYNVNVINAGVSGDTTSGGLARLDWSLGEDVDGVILELGANDALRGISPASTRASLEQIIVRLKQRKLDLLLTGMLAPPNMGPEYARKFNAIFPALAKKYTLAFYPFFLENVAGNPALNQPDGIHPTTGGVKVIVKNILPQVEAMLNRKSRISPTKQ